MSIPNRHTRSLTPPRRRRSWATAARVVACTALAVVTSMLTVAPANASLAAVGPVNAASGFPDYFEDASGLRLLLCNDPALGCTVPVLPNPGNPLSFPNNSPDESFYYLMNSADGSYEAAVEAAYANGAVEPGQEMVFNRIRIRIPGLVPNTTYHITHPYGVEDLTANASGVVNFTDDEGCLAPPCGDFAPVVPKFIGNAPSTSMNFVTAADFDPATATFNTPIGDPNIAGPVKGSPFGTNQLVVTGPNAGGPGLDTLTVSDFTIEGHVAAAPDPARPSTPDLSAADDSGRSTNDNITNNTTPAFTGTGLADSPVELLVDGTVVGSGVVLPDGTYSLTPTALSEGPHTVKVRSGALDSGVLNMKVDLTGPTSLIGFPRPSDGTLTNTPTFTFSGEPDSTFTCSLTSGNAAVAEAAQEPCVAPRVYDAQPNGVKTFRVRSEDTAGNVGPAAPYTWRIGPAPVVQPPRPADTTRPRIASRAPGSGAAGVARGTNVTARLSEAVSGVSGATFVLRRGASTVGAVVSYNRTTRVATINPNLRLGRRVTYTVIMTSGVMDAARNRLVTTSWRFTTGRR